MKSNWQNHPIPQNLTRLKEQIEGICRKCHRNSDEIRLIAITKTHTRETIRLAYDAGIRDFGENRVQELTAKTGQLPEDICWHMVGRIQTNKIRDLVPGVSWIHSISGEKYLREVEKRAAVAGRHLNVLIQINISGENQKSGCEPGRLHELLEYARNLEHVSVRGLMGMAEFTDDRDRIRSQFRLLRQIRDRHSKLEYGPVNLKELSMGMSGDFDLAIKEGATMIRLGSVIFGERSG